MSTSTVTIDQLSSVVSKAATDPTFRAELLANPSSTLQSAGISIPSGASVTVKEDAQNLRYILVTSRPDGISDADLATVQAESIASDGSVAGNIAAYAQLVAKSWTDSSLRSSLLSNPASTLSAHGIKVPSGVEVKAIEASSNNLVVTVPPSSSTSDIAANVESSFTSLTKLITAGSYLAGLGFSIGAIMKFQQHKDNPTQVPIGTPIALVFIAAALLFLPTILGVTGKTVT